MRKKKWKLNVDLGQAAFAIVQIAVFDYQIGWWMTLKAVPLFCRRDSLHEARCGYRSEVFSGNFLERSRLNSG